MVGRKIHITGIVQGVGFRPFVYNLANQLNLTGWVTNSSSGVEIEITGPAKAVDDFLLAIRTKPPPLAKIDNIQVSIIAASQFSSFEIRESECVEGEFIPVSPEIAICEDCKQELFDPYDRRFRYPFINCTNCGPRFSIICDIPYDRPNTTMHKFPLCPECEKEYSNPANRRFHAQPIACPVCGPEVRFIDGFHNLRNEEAIKAARTALRTGKIVAIKGLGGYHLACDATNDKAVLTLRERKKRSDKPFALMAFDLSTIKAYVDVNLEEGQLLQSREKPVVILKKKPGTAISEACAPNQNSLGFMLPYTPLHLLLMEPAKDFPEVLVMTSGNFSEEPIAFQDDDALQRLAPLADGFLTNNRDIQTRIDDSVVRDFKGQTYPIRRARGFAPEPIVGINDIPELLACGAELKNTFCLSRGKYLFLSHHIGDLQNYETLKSFEEGINYYRRIFRIRPNAVAVDLHPDYLSTRYGQNLAENDGLPLVKIQHHHAHLAACIVDNHLPMNEPVIGLTFDGTGYGTDGSIWGGEILFGSAAGYDRRYNLEYMPLPGGDITIHYPSRVAMAYLFDSGLEWNTNLPSVRESSDLEKMFLSTQLGNRINTSMTSSMGRLFDAVSGLIGIRQIASYEGQAAIELENCADPLEDGVYDLEIDKKIILIKPLIKQISLDYLNGVSKAIISAKFHNTIVLASLECTKAIRKDTDCNLVALSGGVWQNMTLLGKMTTRLLEEGFRPLIHHRIPPNDAGISIGQLAILASYLKNN